MIPLFLAAAFATTGLVGLLIHLLVFVLILFVLFWVIGMFPLPQNIKNIVIGILALIALLVIIQRLGFLV